MPIPTFTKLGPNPSFSDLVTKVNVIVGELTNLILNLDSLNVVSLTADHIDAGTIDANVVTLRSDLNAGAYVQIDGNGLRINNGAFNTFIADINGAVTMTSALIQSASGYPKVVMDPASDLFGAYTTSAKYINIFANDSGDPLLYFNNATNLVRIALLGGTFSIGAFGKMVLGSTGDLEISATGTGANVLLTPASGQVVLPEWSRVYSANLTQTLQQALDNKATSGSSTGSAGGHNHGVSPGRYIMTYDAAGNELGLQQWVAASAHSHTQT